MADTHAYVERVGKALSQNADPAIAEGQKAYMRDQFEFFGLKAGKRRAVLRPFLMRNALPDRAQLAGIIHLLWEQPEREYQYFGQELVAKFQKRMSLDDLPLLEFMITHKSWWDTVDFIAAHLIGQLLKVHPDRREICCDRWFESGNIWLQRTALLFQLKYKDNLDRELLSRQIDRLSEHPDFFIRKAIGWILREYSKTDPQWVERFVNDRPELSNLSRKEALRLIKLK